MAYDPFSPRRRQYVFRSRRCRQRIAQALGAGRPVGEVAATARLTPTEVAVLLGDGSFGALVGHYRALAALDRTERLRRLADMALELLELGLAAGDLRIAAFVHHETLCGRDPSMSLAAEVERRLGQVSRPSPAPSPGRPGEGTIAARDDGSDQAGHDLVPPLPPAGEGRGEGSSRNAPRARRLGEADFPFCAATCADEAAALALAAAESGRVEARLAATARGLALRLTDEAERQGTATVPPAMTAPLIETPATAGEVRSAAPALAPPPVPDAGADRPCAPLSAAARPVLPGWLASLPWDLQRYATGLPDHEVRPWLVRVAGVYGLPYEDPG